MSQAVENCCKVSWCLPAITHRSILISFPLISCFAYISWFIWELLLHSQMPVELAHWFTFMRHTQHCHSCPSHWIPISARVHFNKVPLSSDSWLLGDHLGSVTTFPASLSIKGLRRDILLWENSSTCCFHPLRISYTALCLSSSCFALYYLRMSISATLLRQSSEEGVQLVLSAQMLLNQPSPSYVTQHACCCITNLISADLAVIYL